MRNALALLSVLMTASLFAAQPNDCSFLNNTQWSGSFTAASTQQVTPLQLQLQTHYVPDLTELTGAVTIGDQHIQLDGANYRGECFHLDDGSGDYMLRIDVSDGKKDYFLGYLMNAAGATSMSQKYLYSYDLETKQHLDYRSTALNKQ